MCRLRTQNKRGGDFDQELGVVGPDFGPILAGFGGGACFAAFAAGERVMVMGRVGACHIRIDIKKYYREGLYRAVNYRNDCIYGCV